VRHAIAMAVLGLGFAALLGCGPPPAAGDPFLRRGIKLREEGDYGAAADAFERCLRRRPELAEAHLRVALLYEDHLGEPLRALYHFSIYLAERPHGANADLARRSVERLEQAWLTELLARFPEPLEAAAQQAAEAARENARLLEHKTFLIERLREINREVTSLREQLARSQIPNSTEAPVSPAGEPPLPLTPPVTLPAVTTYEVKKGDTLSEVARQLYGSSRYWQALRAANSRTLTDGDILVPGMTLRVPPRQNLEANP